MKDNIAGILALGDHLIDRVAVKANKVLSSDGFWILLVVLILAAAIGVVLAQVYQATA